MPESYDRLLTAPLLRRISHAIDGMRTGEEVWVVVQAEAPYHVRKVTTSEETALAVGEMYPDSLVEGPFMTESDISGESPRFLLWCHNPDSTPCGGSNGGGGNGWMCEELDVSYMNVAEFPADQPMPADGVLKRMEVRWFWDEGDEERSDFREFSWYPGDGENVHPMVDALFFSAAAVEQIFLPYVARVQGADYAQSMQSKLKKGLRRR